MNNEENKYVELNMQKGLWTLEEVVELLHKLGLKVKIVEDKK